MDAAAIRRAAHEHRHHSFDVAEDEVLDDSRLHRSSGGCLIAASDHHDRTILHWACDRGEVLRDALRDYLRSHVGTDVLVAFVPPQFVPHLESIGFAVHCEYVDFWLHGLEAFGVQVHRGPTEIRNATKEEHHSICSITRRCASESRGFTVETPESLSAWTEGPNNALVVAQAEGRVVGHELLSVYAFDSPKGAVVWIRELAVHPDWQRAGIGRQLLTYGLRWGIANRAKRSFLACDAENKPAIRLYEQFGYERRPGRGQIDMTYPAARYTL